MRKYYPGLTLFKFIGALLVLLTHIKTFPLNAALDVYLPGFTVLCSVVVPGFYLMAGFLACKGWMHTAQPGLYIRRYIWWIGRVYLLFCLLQFFTDPLSVVRTGSFAHRSLRYYVEPLLISGPYPQLWFIPPMLVAVALGYWAERRGRLAILGSLTLLGYFVAAGILGPLVALTIQVLGDVPLYHEQHWVLIRILIENYLVRALPFVFAGICVAKWEEWFLQLNKWRIIVPTLLWSVAELVLARFLYPRGLPSAMLFAHLPLTLLLFYGLLKMESRWVQRYHAYLRRLSLFLFFAQWPLIVFNAWLLGNTLALLSPGQTGLCIGLTLSQILLLERLFVWLPRKPDNPPGAGLPAANGRPDRSIVPPNRAVGA
jgi:hypothetical protein